MGMQLDQKVVRPMLVGPVQSRSLRKPILVIVITDGACCPLLCCVKA